MKETNRLVSFFVFSIQQKELSDDLNNQNYELILNVMNIFKLQFLPCEGLYKGIKEKSFILFDTKFVCDDFIKKMMKDYKQESYLYVDGYRNSYSIDNLSGDKKSIGKWMEVYNVNGVDAYTKFDNRYFITF